MPTETLLASEWKRKLLTESISMLRRKEANCRSAHTNDPDLRDATLDVATCHAAAVLIYETELAKMRETPTLPPKV